MKECLQINFFVYFQEGEKILLKAFVNLLLEVILKVNTSSRTNTSFPKLEPHLRLNVNLFEYDFERFLYDHMAHPYPHPFLAEIEKRTALNEMLVHHPFV